MSEQNYIKVLLVDDDEDDYLQTRYLLSKVKNQHYKLDWVDAYSPALMLIREQRHDIYLLDYRLGSDSGLELIREAIGAGCQAPLILLTGENDVEIDQAAMQSGAADYLTKDYLNSTTLERAIRYALKQSQTRLALLESKERYSLALKGARDGIWDWDLRTNQVYYSSRWKAMLGWAENEFENTADEWLKQIHPAEADAVQLALKAYLQRQTPYFESEYRMLHRNGDYRWVLVRGQALWDSTGKAYRMAGSQTDIHQRKLAELALTKEKEQLSTTFSSMGDGVITTDNARQVIFINKIAAQLTGWSQLQAIGQPVAQIFRLRHEKSRQPLPDLVDEVLNSNQSRELEANSLLVARDGREYLIAHTITPTYDQSRQVNGAVIVFRDITGPQQLAEEVFKLNKLESVGLLAGGIAHDFNNLLTVMLGNISLLRLQLESQTLELEAEISPLLEAAETAMEQAKYLTGQLLTFARGGMPVKKPVHLREALEKPLKATLPNSYSGIKLTLAEELWSVELDAGQFYQVIQNLLLNALEAGSAVENISVTATNLGLDGSEHLPLATGNYLQIKIDDRGGGIEPEKLPFIFDPYYTTKTGGNGLGLAISHTIIKKHGGCIIARSQLSKGSTFLIYLPAVSEIAVLPLTVSEKLPAIAKGSGRILVVDDEALIRELTRKALEKLGYQVVTVAEGGLALEAYQAARQSGQAFDLIITDLTIPEGMGGKELIHQLRQFDQQVKVIVSSGYSHDPVMANFKEYGFQGVLNKPYRLTELAQLLAGIFEGQG